MTNTMETKIVRCKNCSTRQIKEIIKFEDTGRYWHSVECDKCGSQDLGEIIQIINKNND